MISYITPLVQSHSKALQSVCEVSYFSYTESTFQEPKTHDRVHVLEISRVSARKCVENQIWVRSDLGCAPEPTHSKIPHLLGGYPLLVALVHSYITLGAF